MPRIIVQVAIYTHLLTGGGGEGGHRIPFLTLCQAYNVLPLTFLVKYNGNKANLAYYATCLIDGVLKIKEVALIDEILH